MVLLKSHHRSIVELRKVFCSKLLISKLLTHKKTWSSGPGQNQIAMVWKGPMRIQHSTLPPAEAGLNDNETWPAVLKFHKRKKVQSIQMLTTIPIIIPYSVKRENFSTAMLGEFWEHCSVLLRVSVTGNWDYLPYSPYESGMHVVAQLSC